MFAVDTRPETSGVMSYEKSKMLNLSLLDLVSKLYSNSVTKLIAIGEEIFKYAFILGVGWERK